RPAPCRSRSEAPARPRSDRVVSDLVARQFIAVQTETPPGGVFVCHAAAMPVLYWLQGRVPLTHQAPGSAQQEEAAWRRRRSCTSTRPGWLLAGIAARSARTPTPLI